MKIVVEQSDKVQLKFEGKINMSQQIVISKADAQKLAQILTKGESSSFETE